MMRIILNLVACIYFLLCLYLSFCFLLSLIFSKGFLFLQCFFHQMVVLQTSLVLVDIDRTWIGPAQVFSRSYLVEMSFFIFKFISVLSTFSLGLIAYDINLGKNLYGSRQYLASLSLRSNQSSLRKEYKTQKDCQTKLACTLLILAKLEST